MGGRHAKNISYSFAIVLTRRIGEKVESLAPACCDCGSSRLTGTERMSWSAKKGPEVLSGIQGIEDKVLARMKDAWSTR